MSMYIIDTCNQLICVFWHTMIDFASVPYGEDGAIFFFLMMRGERNGEQV